MVNGYVLKQNKIGNIHSDQEIKTNAGLNKIMV